MFGAMGMKRGAESLMTYRSRIGVHKLRKIESAWPTGGAPERFARDASEVRSGGGGAAGAEMAAPRGEKRLSGCFTRPGVCVLWGNTKQAEGDGGGESVYAGGEVGEEATKRIQPKALGYVLSDSKH